MYIIVTTTGHLQHMHKECVKYINLEALIPHLNNQDLLSCSQEDDVMNTQLTLHDRITNLLHFISNKADGFAKFCTAVGREKSHRGHHDLFTVLTTESDPFGKT